MSDSTYPTRRSYLLKVHCEALPYALAGRLQNLTTGELREFASGQKLLQSIAGDLAAAAHGTSPGAARESTRQRNLR